jgi:hypothetical protein
LKVPDQQKTGQELAEEVEEVEVPPLGEDVGVYRDRTKGQEQKRRLDDG